MRVHAVGLGLFRTSWGDRHKPLSACQATLSMPLTGLRWGPLKVRKFHSRSQTATTRKCHAPASSPFTSQSREWGRAVARVPHLTTNDQDHHMEKAVMVVTAFFDAFNSRDLDSMFTLLDPQVTYECSAIGVYRSNKQELVKFYVWAMSALPTGACLVLDDVAPRPAQASGLRSATMAWHLELTPGLQVPGSHGEGLYRIDDRGLLVELHDMPGAHVGLLFPALLAAAPFVNLMTPLLPVAQSLGWDLGSTAAPPGQDRTDHDWGQMMAGVAALLPGGSGPAWPYGSTAPASPSPSRTRPAPRRDTSGSSSDLTRQHGISSSPAPSSGPAVGSAGTKLPAAYASPTSFAAPATPPTASASASNLNGTARAWGRASGSATANAAPADPSSTASPPGGGASAWGRATGPSSNRASADIPGSRASAWGRDGSATSSGRSGRTQRKPIVMRPLDLSGGAATGVVETEAQVAPEDLPYRTAATPMSYSNRDSEAGPGRGQATEGEVIEAEFVSLAQPQGSAPPDASGVWEKDLSASQVDGYEQLLTLMGLNGLQRLTARLIDGLQIKQAGDSFVVSFLTVVPFFKVTERSRFSETVQQKRRDLNSGDQTASAERVAGGVRVCFTWPVKQPEASLEEVYALDVGGAELAVTSTLTVGGKRASAVQVYRRSAGSKDQLLQASRKRNASLDSVWERQRQQFGG